MKKVSFGIVLIVLLFLIAGYLSWSLYFRVYVQEDTVSIHQFPLVVEGWAGEDFEIKDYEKEILETDNVFVRKYSNDEGEEVYLFIVYSQTNRKVSHPPEICYTGAGATILSSQHDMIEGADPRPDISANRVLVEQRNINQVFFYWFKVGDTFTSNYWHQQGLIAIKSFLGQPSSSALIRISSTVKDNDEAAAVNRIKKFGMTIVPLLYQYLP